MTLYVLAFPRIPCRSFALLFLCYAFSLLCFLDSFLCPFCTFLVTVDFCFFFPLDVVVIFFSFAFLTTFSALLSCAFSLFAIVFFAVSFFPLFFSYEYCHEFLRRWSVVSITPTGNPSQCPLTQHANHSAHPKQVNLKPNAKGYPFVLNPTPNGKPVTLLQQGNHESKRKRAPCNSSPILSNVEPVIQCILSNMDPFTLPSRHHPN